MEIETAAPLTLLRELMDDVTAARVTNAKILLVGAGGIGCEVMKNLLLTGFTNITVIDLDTIDVSNLNRQFLFNKTHIGKSKSEIAAKVSVENFAHNPNDITVTPIHNSIQHSSFNVDFFKSFTIVINALDNRAARSHVNRMCLAADVPLIESGSEGYLGAVYTIKRDVSQCYECEGPRSDGKTYASCTIRNTPSLPIHCIVWGKHLFAQLFGENDPDNDVSPDMNDPELHANAALTKDNETQTRAASTREWADRNSYDAQLLFEKLFHTDIEYLLSMDKLWENRRRPTPLIFEDVNGNVIDLSARECSSNTKEHNGSITNIDLKDQRLWSLKECLDVFFDSIAELKKRLTDDEYLIWDKDDDSALNFVTAVSNLRSHCFGISRKSKFDVKQMAGNIVPAISSTNSIIGGLIVLQTLRILKLIPDNPNIPLEESVRLYKAGCKHIYLSKVGTKSNLISAYNLEKANPHCLVCSERIPHIEITCSLSETSIGDFVEQILLNKLHFVCPFVTIDGLATAIYAIDDDDDDDAAETERHKQKFLSSFPSVEDKTRLRVDDDHQNQKMIITLKDMRIEKNENDGLFFKMLILEEKKSIEKSIENTGKSDDTTEKELENENVVSDKSVERVEQNLNENVIQLNDSSDNTRNETIDESGDGIDVIDVIDSDLEADDSPIVIYEDESIGTKRKIDDDDDKSEDTDVKKLKK